MRRIRRLRRSSLTERLHALRALSAIRGLRYIDEQNRPHTIELALVPWLLTPAQLALFRRVAQDIVDALLRLPGLYATSSAARDILRLDARQEAWVRLGSHPRSWPWAVMGRLDSTATFDSSNWATGFELLEPNAVGVGGVHYAPASCSVVWDVLSDVLREAYPGRRITPTPDPRQLLTDEMAAMCRRQRRTLRRIALVENVDFTSGTDEFSSLARHFCEQGLDAVVVDPRELDVRRGRLTARGQDIDLVYRDCELGEFIEMERRSRPLRGMRTAVREGRLVSGLLWEFDHKSAWEILTDPTFARYFTPRQRRLFSEHLPWTRLVRHGVTHDPDGRPVELPEFIRRHREQLVLKPNTLYGGQGVLVGTVTSQRVWERTLEQALRAGEPYVAQRLASIATHTFPAMTRTGPREVERRVVSGFFFTSTAIGLVGRFSDDPVVNVSRGGGLVAAFLVE